MRDSEEGREGGRVGRLRNADSFNVGHTYYGRKEMYLVVNIVSRIRPFCISIMGGRDESATYLISSSQGET